ncbi:MAG: hydrogenase maturation nickel metallochaperone HypA [Chloroflexota bacterium]
MHELSIAYSLVNTAEAAARDAGVTAVSRVYLQLGAISGVVHDALLFSYDIATEGTLLEGSTLEIEVLPVIVFCDRCHEFTQLESVQAFRCAQCGNPTADLRQGKEIELVSLEVEDDLLEEEQQHEATHT